MYWPRGTSNRRSQLILTFFEPTFQIVTPGCYTEGFLWRESPVEGNVTPPVLAIGNRPWDHSPVHILLLQIYYKSS